MQATQMATCSRSIRSPGNRRSCCLPYFTTWHRGFGGRSPPYMVDRRGCAEVADDLERRDGGGDHKCVGKKESDSVHDHRPFRVNRRRHSARTSRQGECDWGSHSAPGRGRRMVAGGASPRNKIGTIGRPRRGERKNMISSQTCADQSHFLPPLRGFIESSTRTGG